MSDDNSSDKIDVKVKSSLKVVDNSSSESSQHDSEAISVNQDPEKNLAPTPYKSKTDELLEAAANEMDSEDDEHIKPGQVMVGRPANSHKAIKVFSILLLLSAVGVAAWYFLIKPNNNATSDAGNAAVKTEIKPEVNRYIPSNISYAFKATDRDPLSLYVRSANGGERKEVSKLEKASGIYGHDAKGKVVTYIDDKKVYASIDEGNTFKKIYEFTAEGDVITAIISNDATRIAISEIDQSNNIQKSRAFSVNLTGGDKQAITNSEKAIQIMGYNQEKQKLVFSEGCWACDGARDTYKLYDIKNKKTDLIKKTDQNSIFQAASVSEDVSKFIYVDGTFDANYKVDGIGSAAVAPYRMMIVDLQTLQESIGDTVGTKGEKNPNGTQKSRDFEVGFLAGSDTPYYAEDKELFTIDSNKSSLLYQADKPILNVHFASDKYIVVSTGDQPSDFLLSNYTIKDKKSTTIFSGDNNTTILGVTTK